jgi:hypothetical protein
MTIRAHEAEILPPAATLGPAISQPQTPYFQWYLRKSLWKKYPDSASLPSNLSRSASIKSNLKPAQAIYYQGHTEMCGIASPLHWPNQSSHFFSHFLHSSPPGGWLRVTSGRVCRVHRHSIARLGSPSLGPRIVPLTRPISRTILAEPTREAAGERPRKFFRE